MKKLLLILILSTSWVSLSHAEKDKISFCFDPWPPVHSLDKSGKPIGLFIDLVEVMFVKNLGMQVEYLQLPWKRCQSYVQDGEVDFMITTITDERTQYSMPTENSVYDMYNSVYTYKGNSRLNAIDEIKQPKDVATNDFTVVTYLGNGWYKKNFSEFRITTTYLNNIEPAIQFLATKRADIFIGGDIVVNYQIKQQKLQDKIVQTKVGFDPYLMTIMLSKKSDHIENLPKINAEVNQFIKSDEYKQILSQYSLSN